jgi:hypothetical protein
VDLSILSTDDLRALAANDFSKVSTEGLQYLATMPERTAPARPTPPAKSAGFSPTNLALESGQSLVGATKSILEGFGAGNAPAEYLEGVSKKIGSYISPERQAEIQRRSALEKQAAASGKTVEEITTALGGVTEAPATAIAKGVASSVPTVALGLGAAAATVPVLTALGVTVGAPVAIAAAVGLGVKFLVGALQGAGEVKGDIYSNVKAGLEAKGVKPEAAAKQAEAAQDYLGENRGNIATALGLGAVAGGTGQESKLMGMFSKPVAKKAAAEAVEKAAPGFARRTATEFVKEAVPEGLQAGQGQRAQNVAMTRAGMETPEMQGVLGAMARDALVGGITGAAVSTAAGGPKAEAPATAPSAEAPAAPTATTEPEVARTWFSLLQEKEELKKAPSTPEVQDRIRDIDYQMQQLTKALYTQEVEKATQAKTDEVKAKESAFANAEPQQMEIREAQTTDKLPPLPAQAEPAPEGLRDVIAAELPATTEVLEDAGIAPTSAELEAAGQQRLDMYAPAPLTEQEVVHPSMSKAVKQWMRDNIVGKTPDEAVAFAKANPTAIPDNRFVKKAFKEIEANIPAPETQNANGQPPAVQSTAKPRAGKRSVAVPARPITEPGAGDTGVTTGIDQQRLVSTEQPVDAGVGDQTTQQDTLDPEEVARQQEAAAVAARLAEQEKKSAQAVPEATRTVVPDRATRREGAVDVVKMIPQIQGALTELLSSSKFPEGVKTDAKRHLRDVEDAVKNKGEGTEAVAEMAFNFLTEQASKTRFQFGKTTTAPMTRDKVQALVDKVKAAWKNAPTITVVQNMNDPAVPTVVRAHLAERVRQGETGSPTGFYHNGQVYVVADSMSSPQDVVTTLAHEVLGHYGLRGLFGGALDASLLEVQKAYPAEMQRLAKQRGFDLTNPEQALEVAEEILADLAQTKPTLGIVQRAVAAIRAMLRKVLPDLQMTNNDIIAKFILPARAFVESGVAPQADQGTRFGVDTTTSAFKRWFGNSKVVDAEGKPLVIYHGTLANITTFKMSPDGALGAGIYLTPRADFANTYADTSNLSRPDADIYEIGGQNVLPLYASIQNPLVLDGKRDPMVEALVKLGMDTTKAENLVEKAYEENGYVGKQVMTRAKAQGYDGLMQYRDGELMEVVAFSSNQVKSAIGNTGDYSLTNNDIRYAMGPDVATRAAGVVYKPTTVTQAVKQATSSAVAAVKPLQGIGAVDKVRTMVVDRFAAVSNRLAALYDGAVRDAAGKTNALAIARQAEDVQKMLPALFEEGGLRINPATGLYETYRLKDAPQDVYVPLQKWIKSKGLDFETGYAQASTILEGMRVHELVKQNAAGATDALIHWRDTNGNIDTARIAQAVAEYNASPDLKEMTRIMDAPRIELINQLEKAGRLTAEDAKFYREAINYVPFDRLSEIDDKYFSGAKRISGRGLAQLGKLPELVGSENRPVGNVIDNYFRTMGWLAQQLVKQNANTELIGAMGAVGAAKYIGPSQNASKTGFTVPLFRNGEKVFYDVPTKYDAAAFIDSPRVPAVYWRQMAKASKLLRLLVTANPAFAVGQVATDIQGALLTSGVKHPLSFAGAVVGNFAQLSWHELKSLGADLTGKDSKMHDMERQFGRTGLHGDVDYNAPSPASTLLYDLNLRKRTPIQSIIHRLEKITNGSDLAVRKAVYDYTLKDTKDELLANTRARELINFHRRGTSALAQDLITTVPFLNAAAQGTDLLYRAATGRENAMGVESAAARKMFLQRVSIYAAGALAYAMTKAGDDEYDKLNRRTRDNNWILGNGVKIPIRGDIAVVKVAIENAVDWQRRQGTKEERQASEAVLSVLNYAREQYVGRITPIPIAIKPVVEAFFNHSALTGRELIGTYQQGMLPHMQVGKGTSELAKTMAEYMSKEFKYEVSPIIIDNTLKGYFGTSAAAVMMVTDSMLHPNRPDRPMHQWMLVSNFAYDSTQLTNPKDEFYDLRAKVIPIQNTLNELAKTDVAKAREFVQEHKEELALSKGVLTGLKQLSDLRKYRKYLESAEGEKAMSKDKREAELAKVLDYENKSVSWVREAKTMTHSRFAN